MSGKRKSFVWAKADVAATTKTATAVANINGREKRLRVNNSTSSYQQYKDLNSDLDAWTDPDLIDHQQEVSFTRESTVRFQKIMKTYHLIEPSFEVSICASSSLAP